MKQEVPILSLCSIHGAWGCRKTYFDGLVNIKKYLTCVLLVSDCNELTAAILTPSRLLIVDDLPTPDLPRSKIAV